MTNLLNIYQRSRTQLHGVRSALSYAYQFLILKFTVQCFRNISPYACFTSYANHISST